MPDEEIFTSYIVDNDRAFADALTRLAAVTDDFRIPLGLIGGDFYKSERIIFQLKGPGLYQDLSPKYKSRKQRMLGFAYPILVGRTKRLSESMLGPDARDSVYELGKDSLTLGTETPWAIYHQSDRPRRKIPLRKFLFITGGTNETSRDSRITGRIDRWLLIMDNYIKQVTTRELA